VYNQSHRLNQSTAVFMTYPKYLVYPIENTQDSAIEHVGSKEKGRLSFKMNGKFNRFLWKKGREHTGENWAEKVTCELADLLGLPHAQYEFGLIGGKQCVITKNFLHENEELILGNQLIEGFDSNIKFDNNQHTLSAILSSLRKNLVNPWRKSEKVASNEIQTSTDLFMGYLCFDAWVGNTDRHAENWAMIKSVNKTNFLCPTFDHASSLGRNVTEEERVERLKTKDKGYSVNAYVRRAKTPIYDDFGNRLGFSSLLKECRAISQKTTQFWVDKISTIMDSPAQISSIFQRVPDDFITKASIDFAVAFLCESFKMISEVESE